MRLKRIFGFLVLCVGVSSVFIWREGQLAPVSQAEPAPLSEEVLAQKDVPYVPTPKEVVKKMLQLASVTKDDVVYDLGSGDGRLVIEAAKLGAKGVGVELNTRLVVESRENAISAGVRDRVRFIEQDLFKTDLTPATVITLYLLPKVNLQLRPTLLQLKPGTRLVSHQFDMREWKPDQTELVQVGSRPHLVYYWVVPAQVSGTWEWNMPTASGEERYKLQLSQEFQRVKGTLSIGDRVIKLTDAKLTGDRLSFKTVESVNGTEVTMQFDGKIQEDAIAGSVDLGGNEAQRRDWVAKRQS